MLAQSSVNASVLSDFFFFLPEHVLYCSVWWALVFCEDCGLPWFCSVPERHQLLVLITVSWSFCISMWFSKQPENLGNPKFTRRLSGMPCHSDFSSGKTSYIHGSSGSMIVLEVRIIVFFFLKWEISSIQVTREDFFFYQIFDFWEKKLWFDHYVLCFYLRHQSVLSTFFVFYVPSFGCF